MFTNHTSTIYVFQKANTRHLLFKTSDLTILHNTVPSYVITEGETVVFDGKKYKIVHFYCELSVASSFKSVLGEFQLGENNPYSIHAMVDVEEID